jgi:diadenosine tetraphosphatase ApaH/serine/threonine PP2A family protein phosphatase
LSIRIEPESKYLINPGSAGQPRDGDPRASFGIMDTVNHEFCFYRTPYNIELMKENIRKFDLPFFLGERLGYGI